MYSAEGKSEEEELGSLSLSLGEFTGIYILTYTDRGRDRQCESEKRKNWSERSLRAYAELCYSRARWTFARRARAKFTLYPKSKSARKNDRRRRRGGEKSFCRIPGCYMLYIRRMYFLRPAVCSRSMRKKRRRRNFLEIWFAQFASL